VTPRVAILVLNCNGKRWLEKCFAAVLAQSSTEIETWLVDNGSSDGSVSYVRERFPGVKIMAFGGNLGFGAAYNRAVDATSAPLIALLNNDTIVQPGWLNALTTALEPDHRVAVVGSKLLFMNRPMIVNHAGGRLTIVGAAYDIGFGQLDGVRFEHAGPIGCASGAALLMRREAFIAAGGFDERYFAYFDDADLCWRFWLGGRSVLFEPRARVLHAYGGSSGAGRRSSLRIQHCQTNRLQNMLKNLETRTLLATWPASLAYDVIRVCQLGRVPRHGRAVLALARGWHEFVRRAPHAMAQRRRIQRARQRTDVELMDTGVLVGLRTAAAEWSRLESLRDPAGFDTPTLDNTTPRFE
jgi:GT2 family glycosyltransferase